MTNIGQAHGNCARPSWPITQQCLNQTQSIPLAVFEGLICFTPFCHEVTIVSLSPKAKPGSHEQLPLVTKASSEGGLLKFSFTDGGLEWIAANGRPYVQLQNIASIN